jgi:hypothetical protein
MISEKLLILLSTLALVSSDTSNQFYAIYYYSLSNLNNTGINIDDAIIVMNIQLKHISSTISFQLSFLSDAYTDYVLMIYFNKSLIAKFPFLNRK